MNEHERPASSLTPVRPDLLLDGPVFDELREVGSLVVRIRDENDVGVNVEFKRYLAYYKSAGSQGLDHWLYVAEGSDFLEWFLRRNPHLDASADIKHYVVVTSNDVVDVIASIAPAISIRTDNARTP